MRRKVGLRPTENEQRDGRQDDAEGDGATVSRKKGDAAVSTTGMEGEVGRDSARLTRVDGKR